MAQVDFYVLDVPPGPATERFACRLINRAFTSKHTIFVRTENPMQAKRLDDLLWTFSDTSFVPHEIIDSASQGHASPAPVALGADYPEGLEADITLNLCPDAVPNVAGEHRVLEIIANEAASKAQGRERYRSYQQLGHELTTHEIKPEP